MGVRALRLLQPWEIWEYPGRNRALSEILGIARETARQYASGRRELPPKHALRLADYLMGKAIQMREISEELRKDATERGVRKRRGQLQRLQMAHEKNRVNRIRKVKESLDSR